MRAMLWAVLLIASAFSISSAATEYHVTAGSLWGGPADEQLEACAMTPAGIALIGGTGHANIQVAKKTGISGATGPGVLLRFDSASATPLSLTTFPAPVKAIAVDADGNVFVCAGTTYKLDANCEKVIWAGGPSGHHLTLDGEGGAWVWDGGTASHILPGGQIKESFPAKGRGFAIDFKGKRFFTCAHTSGKSTKSGNPVHVPWVKAFDFTGKQLWHMYNFTPTEVDTVGDMADSHPQRLFFAPDGKLYMFGDSDGGNTAYRHDPLKLGGDVGAMLKGTPFNELHRAFRSNRLLFVCRINPASGALERGSFFYGTYTNPQKNNRVEIGDAQAKALHVDADGRIYLAGTISCLPKFTPNAVHKDVPPPELSGYYKNIASAPELYMAVLEDDFKTLSFCSGFNQGTANTYNGAGLAVAGCKGAAVVVGCMKTPDAGSDKASATAYLSKSLQPAYGGGKDGYFATLNAASSAAAKTPAAPAVPARR